MFKITAYSDTKFLLVYPRDPYVVLNPSDPEHSNISAYQMLLPIPKK